MKINILGTDYTVKRYDYKDLQIFEERQIDGYCDSVTKEIAIVNMKTYPSFENEPEDYCRKVEKHTMRHEIVHAFLNESGLQDSSLSYNAGWAKNEEMIDWIAYQLPKIQKAFKDAGCL